MYDLLLNGGRTHIVESYPFDRSGLDLPSRLAPREAFGFDGLLRDLVPTWQTASPIRALEGEGWHEPGAFYVHVGTEDSLGSSLPPGAMALVEPISNDERLQPSPRRIYLLQFGNGYRCSHCVATGGKLRLFSTGKAYLGQEAFSYPGSVRIAGRIRMFATILPVLEYPSLRLPLPCRQCADLILPWEHRTRDKLSGMDDSSAGQTDQHPLLRASTCNLRSSSGRKGGDRHHRPLADSARLRPRSCDARVSRAGCINRCCLKRGTYV